MVRWTMADSIGTVSPAVRSFRVVAALQLVECWILGCGAIVVAVRVGLGVASAQHTETQSECTRVTIVGGIITFRRDASVAGSVGLVRGGGSIVRGSGVAIGDFGVVREGDALALLLRGTSFGRADGTQAIGVKIVGGAAMELELTGLASEFAAARIRGFEVLGIVEVLVVDADDTRIAGIHRESYA